MRQRGQLVDAALDKFVPRRDYFPAKLHSAVRHSLFSGGKRLRPVLVLAAAEACGGSARDVLPAACALECIHTYSLIHDDLPAMDDDDLRRGQPTCHKVFGEAAAILAGDGLLTLAFELMARCPVRDDRQLAAIRLLAQASGMAGMVGGQMADIDAEGEEVSLPLLQYIHTHKTGRLIQASVLIGGALAGGTPAQLKALGVFGETMGLAFQIADDILNVVGTQEQLGKSTGTDSARGKATYPAYFGLEESRRQAQALLERGLAALEPFGRRAAPLRALANFTVQREV
ncbi:MAG: polyprenyl synthetase family protein [candidate division FCPU426 bacterium]